MGQQNPLLHRIRLKPQKLPKKLQNPNLRHRRNRSRSTPKPLV